MINYVNCSCQGSKTNQHHSNLFSCLQRCSSGYYVYCRDNVVLSNPPSFRKPLYPQVVVVLVVVMVAEHIPLLPVIKVLDILALTFTELEEEQLRELKFPSSAITGRPRPPTRAYCHRCSNVCNCFASGLQFF